MKTINIVLLVLVSLAINNIALLWYTGNLSSAKNSPITIQVDQVKANLPVAEKLLAKPDVSSPTPLANNQPISVVEDSNQENNHIVIEEVKNYVNSQEFTELLDNWQLGATERYSELEKRIVKMDASELYSMVLESDSSFERQSALSTLIQTKLGRLTTEQLKQLYQQGSMHSYYRTSLLTTLLDRDDRESLELAKSFVTEQSAVSYSTGALLSSIYEKDPEFIQRYLNNIDTTDSTELVTALGFVMQEPELSKSFVSKNFDQILESNNSDIYRSGLNDLGFDLSANQQSKVLNMFDSSSRKKRGFAINLIRNIDDADDLRNAYAKLSRKSEQRRFISMLRSNQKNSEIKALAKELHENFAGSSE